MSRSTKRIIINISKHFKLPWYKMENAWELVGAYSYTLSARAIISDKVTRAPFWIPVVYSLIERLPPLWKIPFIYNIEIVYIRTRSKWKHCQYDQYKYRLCIVRLETGTGKGAISLSHRGCIQRPLVVSCMVTSSRSLSSSLVGAALFV